MIDVSYIVTLAVVLAFLAMVVVIFLLARTTRKVIDKNAALSERLLGNDAGRGIPSAALSAVDQIRQDLDSMEKPWQMDDASLMAWMDARMEELALYQQPDLDLKTVSEALGISQRHILRLLKNQSQYGSFSVYITEKRLAKACSLLRSHPEYTIEAICLDAGFRTRRTFQAVFKSRLGISPSEFRSSVKNDLLTN